MGRTRAALSGLACAFVALATPAAAFTAIDPLPRQPLYSAEEALKAQAAPVAREVVTFNGRYAGTQGFRHLRMTNVAYCDGHADSLADRFTETDDSDPIFAEHTGFLAPDNYIYGEPR